MHNSLSFPSNKKYGCTCAVLQEGWGGVGGGKVTIRRIVASDNQAGGGITNLIIPVVSYNTKPIKKEKNYPWIKSS